MLVILIVKLKIYITLKQKSIPSFINSSSRDRDIASGNKLLILVLNIVLELLIDCSILSALIIA